MDKHSNEIYNILWGHYNLQIKKNDIKCLLFTSDTKITFKKMPERKLVKSIKIALS